MNSSSLIAAICVTSNRPPIRCAITSGPLNAFSIGTCWSRTIPMSSALSFGGARVSLGIAGEPEGLIGHTGYSA